MSAVSPPTAQVDRLRRAVRRYGVAGTAREAFRQVSTYPARRRWERADREFDREFGVDTAGVVRLHELSFESENKGLGNRYEATTPDGFRALLGSLDLGADELTFIDMGSGKGRALLLASEFGFRRIVGVEFSPELTAVAQTNVERFAERTTGCREFELVCADASKYELPDEPTLLYIYNAFEAPVMEAVLANARASITSRPRRFLLVIVNRSYPLEAVEAAGFKALDERGEVFEPVS